GDVRDAEARDLDHVLRDVDSRDPVAAPGEVLAHPARAAADVQHLGAEPELQLVDNVREGAQAGRELEARRRAEGLRLEPEPLALRELLDVVAMPAVVVVSEGLEAPVSRAPEPAELACCLPCDGGTHSGTIVARRHLDWPA